MGRILHELWIGPGVMISANALAIVVAQLTLDGHPEETWLTSMLIQVWFVALLVYIAYALVAFFLTVKIAELLQQRRR